MHKSKADGADRESLNTPGPYEVLQYLRNQDRAPAEAPTLCEFDPCETSQSVNQGGVVQYSGSKGGTAGIPKLHDLNLGEISQLDELDQNFNSPNYPVASGSQYLSHGGPSNPVYQRNVGIHPGSDCTHGGSPVMNRAPNSYEAQYSQSQDRVTDTPMTAFAKKFDNINPVFFPGNEDVEKQLNSLNDHDMEILQPVDQCNSGLDPNSYMDLNSCIKDNVLTVGYSTDIEQIVNFLGDNLGVQGLVIDGKKVEKVVDFKNDVKENVIYRKISLTQMEDLVSVTGLIELDLEGCCLNAKGVIRCLANSNLINLRTLNLDTSGIRTRSVKILASGNLANLTSLTLSSNDIGHKGVEALANSDLTSLTSLVLDNNDIGDEGAVALANGNLRNLTSLILDNNDIGDKGAGALANGNLVNLEDLRLDINQIKKAGLSELANGKFKNLEILSLIDNAIGNEGAKILANSGLKNLRELILSNSDIGDEGAVALVSSNNDKLKELMLLDLSKNRISDEGLERLGSLINMNNMNDLQGFRVLLYSQKPVNQVDDQLGLDSNLHQHYQTGAATSSSFGESYEEGAVTLPGYSQVGMGASGFADQVDGQLDSNFSLYQHHPAGAAASHSYGALQGLSSSQHDPNSYHQAGTQKSSEAPLNYSKVSSKTAHKLENKTPRNLYSNQSITEASGSASQVDNQHPSLSHHQPYQGSAEISSRYQYHQAGVAVSSGYSTFIWCDDRLHGEGAIDQANNMPDSRLNDANTESFRAGRGGVRYFRQS